jgi:hypothetical protein
MRRILGLSAVLVGLASLISSAPVHAGSCASGSTCTFELTNTNIQELAGIDIQVTVDNTGATTLLSYELISSPLSNTALGLDTFFYNDAATITPCPGGFNCNFDGTTAGGGFGDFASHRTEDPAGTGGISSPVTLTLSALVTSFAENDQGGEFATHIRFAGIPEGSCSGWVSDGTTSESTSLSPCVPGQQRVPEPGMLSLLGLGFASFAYLKRRG